MTTTTVRQAPSPRSLLISIGKLALAIVVLLLALAGVATAQPPATTDPAPAEPTSEVEGPEAPGAPTVPPAGQAIMIITSKDTVYPGGAEPNPFETAMSGTTPEKPINLHFTTLCTANANSRVGNSVIWSSAQHCIAKETHTSMLEADYRAQMRQRQKEEGGNAAVPADVPPWVVPTQEELPEIDPKITIQLFQPLRVPGRYIEVPTDVTPVNARELGYGNDTLVLKLNLLDPNVNVPIITVADTAPGPETEVLAVGYSGSTMPAELSEYMFPEQREDKKTLADFLRDNTTISPTVTDGIVSGTEGSVDGPAGVENAGVTKTNADMTGGMSGGLLVAKSGPQKGKQIGIVRGGFGGGGGNFNYVSSDLDLLRQDLIAAGAIIPLSDAEKAQEKERFMQLMKDNFPELAEENASSNGGSSWFSQQSVNNGTLAALGLFIAVALGTLAYLAFNRRGNTYRDETTHQDTAGVTTPREEHDDSLPPAQAYASEQEAIHTGAHTGPPTDRPDTPTTQSAPAAPGVVDRLLHRRPPGHEPA